MVELRLYNDIGSNKNNILASFFGFIDTVFSADVLKDFLEVNKDEKEFKININCSGGSVEEGFVIYDLLRTSGKTIHCNVEGACHSMALVILLAAPLENRTANQNSTALIHQVRANAYGQLTAEEAKTLSTQIEEMDNKIASIYSERIGKNKASCLALMKAEKKRSAQELLNLGFISSINFYNTNMAKKNQNQKPDKKQTIGQRVDAFLNRAGRLLGDPTNYDYTDAEGNVLFSTESEEDALEVGDTVTLPGDETGGEYYLPDGREVTIVDNVVTEIKETEPPGDEPTMEDVQTENAELKTELENARKIIVELNNKIESNFTPPTRTTKPNSHANKTPTKDEMMAQMREGRNKFNNHTKK